MRISTQYQSCNTAFPFTASLKARDSILANDVSCVPGSPIRWIALSIATLVIVLVLHGFVIGRPYVPSHSHFVQKLLHRTLNDDW